ncbi:hypothetical protein SARC_09164 [Sphaeroforma arctica JP610]|uniref:Uncharacterized protein n=1 Tax=Sphaeroforma arctica JP610 TaxID=667725 RepID=A0A0L0FNK4_9EUKA|nr:hypothetical protein SARC_09164 [Sphaeroforma arctica JP610]KNC78405.1 hypothetical protein SARC_09164 [Sphaeroforma arctica JP610]|eukprot:XP_014152307.1 hypothetical protein SARC_09164 [Sphaeroforma arctica JP610]
MSITLDKTFAALPATKRGTNVLLSADPKGEKLLYCCYRSVITRDIASPDVSDIYQQHAQECTTARYAPSGYYIASADTAGNVRIWDTVNEEHILKHEYRPLSGPIKDLAWSEDSKRIVVGGEGKETFGAAFLVDTGSSVGGITGHAKAINSIDMKPNRPYRVITASEDNASGFYQGPPFKFSHSNTDHTKFCQVARYKPDGSVYVTAGSDGRIFTYDGKSGEKQGEVGSTAHKGSVMCVSWSPDGSELLSVSADRTAKIWKVSGVDSSVLCVHVQRSDIHQSDVYICIYIYIYVNIYIYICIYINININTHMHILSSLTTQIYSGDFTGRIVEWDASTGNGQTLTGTVHTNQVNTLLSTSSGQLISVAMDDTLIASKGSSSDRQGVQTSTGSCPLSAAHGGDITALACAKGIEVYRGSEKILTEDTEFDCTVVAVSPDARYIAVGAKDSKVRLFDFSSGKLSLVATKDCKGALSACAFSPCGTKLATGDSGRNVFLHSCPDLETVQSGWVFHSAKVNCMAWAKDGKHLVTGGIDQNIIVWSLEQSRKRLTFKNAHQGAVTGVDWLSDNKIVSAGQDAHVRTWDLTFH